MAARRSLTSRERAQGCRSQRYEKGPGWQDREEGEADQLRLRVPYLGLEHGHRGSIVACAEFVMGVLECPITGVTAASPGPQKIAVWFSPPR